MYLIVADANYQQNIKYFFCSGIRLDQVKLLFPNYANITKDEIEEIIVYSHRKDDGHLYARIVNCAGYSANERNLRIEYGDVISDSEYHCETIRKKIYAMLFGKKLLTRGEGNYAPSVLFVEDIQDYNYIKRKKKEPVNESQLAHLANLFGKNDWIGIVKSCPNMETIEQDDIWNDEECLSKLAFALSKLAGRSMRKTTEDDERRKKYNESAFLKVINRCIELNPYSSMHKSAFAYFLYDRYKREYDDDDFQKAKSLYEALIETSSYSFKEKYRYANLLRAHYELPANRYASESYKEFSRVVKQYDLVIDSYEELPDEEKKQQKSNYRKALYQYVVLFIEQHFGRFGNVLFNSKMFGEKVPGYLIDMNAAEQITKCSALMEKIVEISPRELTKSNVNDKPGYIDIQYRLAQLSMSKGYLRMLRGSEKTDYINYFEEAAGLLDDTLQEARKAKKEGVRFLFPDYLKVPLAFCYFLLDEKQKCEDCFKHAKPWMQFEQARIYLFEGNNAKAEELLRGIPERDKCKNKANVLLAKIGGAS